MPVERQVYAVNVTRGGKIFNSLLMARETSIWDGREAVLEDFRDDHALVVAHAVDKEAACALVREKIRTIVAADLWGKTQCIMLR
jgi:hypothetical protein